MDTWGSLPKSQIDNSTVDEEIAALIAAHEADVDAHLEVGESLQSHKASEIIDHIAESIVNDKLKANSRSYVAIVDVNSASDFDDIQEAIDYAASVGGGNILIMPGSYNPLDHIVISENVELFGFDAENSVIDLTPAELTKGTISYETGSQIFTGVGTAFVDDGIKTGDIVYFSVPDEYWEVDEVTDNTHLTVVDSVDWDGTDLANTIYKLVKIKAGAVDIPATAGTLGVTNNSTAVVGTSTDFTDKLVSGDFILINDVLLRIASITDATHLTLTQKYLGETLSGIKYYAGTMVSNVGLNNISIVNSWPWGPNIYFYLVRNSKVLGVIGHGSGGEAFFDYCDSIQIHGSDFSYRYVDAGYGILSRFCSNMDIQNNICVGNYYDGINVYNSFGGNYVVNNVASQNRGYGIGLYNSSSQATTGNVCKDNFCVANYGSGIKLYRVEKSVISGNISRLNDSEGINSEYGNNNVINGNVCDGNNEDGISYIKSGADGFNVISNNQCKNSGINGIFINSNRNVINGNVCDGNAADGIHLQTATTKNIVAGNVFYNNTVSNIDDDGTANLIGDNITS